MRILSMTMVAALAAASPASVLADEPSHAPLPPAELARSLVIDARSFTLENGLRVVVHTDRKAPIVAVTVAYDVGSADEPAGHTGLAHLFEHLMFNGSENAPGDYFGRVRALGALAQNGSTSYDSTVFHETVPTGALERTLFLESDRMGHLLGAITPVLLDKQRGIVENEKRERERGPYALAQNWLREEVLGTDHPAAHSTLGSFADLSAVTVADARAWFRLHYGPDRAVLVLAGDIDAVTARRLAQRYFGDIPRGPAGPRVRRPVAPLAAAAERIMTDRVPAVSINRSWIILPRGDRDEIALEMAASVLNDPDGAFAHTLVDRERLAASVAVAASAERDVGLFSIVATLAPGVDRKVLLARIEDLLSDFLRTGPDAAAMNRIVRREIGWRLQSMEGVADKMNALVSGMMDAGDPDRARKRLMALAALDSADVRDAAARWLSRPAFTLVITPGERQPEPLPPRHPADASQTAATSLGIARYTRIMPPVGPTAAMRFPDVERTRLGNGIGLVFARWAAAPLTTMAIRFDAGIAAQDPAAPQVQPLMLALLREGAGARDGAAIAEEKDALGISMTDAVRLDRTELRIAVPSANLAPALDLLAATLRRPTFPETGLARVKIQATEGIRQSLASAQGQADRLLPSMLYGKASPYAVPPAAMTPDAVAAVGRADIAAFHRAWLRPEKATIYAVSDRPFAEVRALLEAGFGDWQGTGKAGVKRVAVPAPPARPSILLVDRPGDQQSLVIGYQPTPLTGHDDLTAVSVASRALAGDFDSRINTDLREVRHWSYGADGGLEIGLDASAYRITTSVQADRTAATIAAIRDQVAAFVADRPMMQEEFERTRDATIAAMPGRFERNDALLTALAADDLYGRPSYTASLVQRYEALTLPDVRSAIRMALSPVALQWLVVGDAAIVEPQLRSLGLPTIRIRPTSTSTAKTTMLPATTAQIFLATSAIRRRIPPHKGAGIECHFTP